MTDRQRAHDILREAKEALAQRLTELVLAGGDDILADARGDSYMNEIETLYEQVGMKLAHISQMLANVPAEIVGPPPSEPMHPVSERGDTFTVATEASPSADAVVADTTPALMGPVFVATPALPAPQMEARPDAGGSTFQQFAERIQAQDMSGAGAALGSLLGLPKSRAVACARTFARRLRSDEDFLRKVMQLRGELEAGSSHGVVALLVDCFGLTGVEALRVMNLLHRRLVE
ncbi:MAG TPA: hypothetical protein VMP01_21530 [Pirellulaceae bacterium]|nr:hypothetical protein [Pirellulaceae bacterium]